MDRRNLVGLGVIAVASAAVVGLTGPAYDAVQALIIKNAAGGAETEVVTGEAQGFGGTVKAEVTVAGDKIIALTLTGEGETPEIGGAAMTALTEAITANQSLDGVDAVSGATITSDAVFAAIRSAMGGAEAPANTEETDAYEGETSVVTGEGDGYGGKIQAEVTLSEDGTIVGLSLTGDDETPSIGGAALETLKTAILENGSLDGVDAVSGATWTSNGVFDAIRSAMGEDLGGESGGEKAEMTAAGLSHGLGFYSTGRVGPGKDDQGTGVYSFNEVVAYVLFDNDGRILDLEVDQLEVATPNYDGSGMPDFTGFPGQSYSEDKDHDGKVDGTAVQTEDSYLAQVDAWKTKRERGNTYKLDSGSWEQEMDIFESAFLGFTADEVKEWYETYCSDLNGRPLHGTSDKEEDIAKYEALTDLEKTGLDGIAGATMSLNDAHGNIIGAIERAYENRRPVEAEKVAKIGLGFTNTGRLGPGKDDQGTGVYSFNTQAVGAAYDADGKIIALYTDVMEVATPNYDGEYMPNLTGFPGQSYNADENHDEKVDAVLDQTDDSFLAQVDTWKTKRERGDTYKLDAGTWADEMDIFEAAFAGMTADEVSQWYETYCSDVNGRPLHGTSENEEDIKKYEAFTDEDKAALDAVSGATMSLKDPHGDILGAIVDSWTKAKDTNITIE
ncbi:MAG: FMN-binding protein [Eubacteriales bacterium]|nr:FMN-binding protein [Eubacteriales bacterium]